MSDNTVVYFCKHHQQEKSPLTKNQEEIKKSIVEGIEEQINYFNDNPHASILMLYIKEAKINYCARHKGLILQIDNSRGPCGIRAHITFNTEITREDKQELYIMELNEIFEECYIKAPFMEGAFLLFEEAKFEHTYITLTFRFTIYVSE